MLKNVIEKRDRQRYSQDSNASVGSKYMEIQQPDKELYRFVGLVDIGSYGKNMLFFIIALQITPSSLKTIYSYKLS